LTATGTVFPGTDPTPGYEPAGLKETPWHAEVWTWAAGCHRLGPGTFGWDRELGHGGATCAAAGTAL